MTDPADCWVVAHPWLDYHGNPAVWVWSRALWTRLLQALHLRINFPKMDAVLYLSIIILCTLSRISLSLYFRERGTQIEGRASVVFLNLALAQ